MVEDTGRDIGNRIGKFLEADERSWQSDQAKYMRVRVELLLYKPLRRGGYLLNGEGKKVWVTFKYERLPTVCYRCGRLGHDDRHCDAVEPGQATEYQYGEWIRANGSSRGGPERLKPRQEVHRLLSNEWRRTVAQPTTAKEAMVGDGERNGRDDVVWDAEKQVGWGDVGDAGMSESQATCQPGGRDSSVVSPPNAEMSDLTRATRKVLNFEINGSEGNAPGMDHSVVGLQEGHILEEMEVTSPIKPVMDFSEYKDHGYLDTGYKNKELGPKTIGSWKRLAREKGLVKMKL